MISLGAVKLGLAIYSRLSKSEDRVEIFKTLVKAVGDRLAEALAEYMSPEDWEKILPAPRTPPPSRVDIRKAEAFARRYGNEAREIVDKCRDRLEKTLRLKKLTPKGDNTRGESTHGR